MFAAMIKRLTCLVVAALACLATTAISATAHPHVWVTMRSEVLYAPDGTVRGIRHAWTFDDMFSAFSIQGLEAPPSPSSAAKAPEPKSEGFFARVRSAWSRMWNWMVGAKSEPKASADKQIASTPPAPAPIDRVRGPTREELMPLAKTNIESLKDFDYFTVAKVNGQPADFIDPPGDYYLEYKDQTLTLHFTLPFKAPVKAQDLQIEVYDASYFVDFSFEKDNAVGLVGAPAACKLVVVRPEEMDPAMAAKLFQMTPDAKLDPSELLGAQFASRILVKCS